MKYSKQAWDQPRAKTCDEIVTAILRDGFAVEDTAGAIHGYRHPDGRRVTIHYHPKKSYRPNLLKALLADLEWSERDMRRLKLIK